MTLLARNVSILAGLLAFVPSLAAQDIWVVAEDGSGNGTTFDAVLPLASDGDTILVRAGTYPGFLVSGKSVSIVAKPGEATPLVTSVVEVRELGPGQAVSISGLELRGKKVSVSVPSGALDGFALVAGANAGSIVVSDCTLRGAPGDNVGPSRFHNPGKHAAGWHAVVAQSCAAISFERCSIFGGSAADVQNIDTGENDGFDGGAGILALDCNVTVHESSLTGGSSNFSDDIGGNGGPGSRILTGALFAAGSQFRGGKGGTAFDFITGWTPGNGGAGLELATSSSSGVLLMTSTTGGDPGGSFFGGPGQPGQPTSGPGSLTILVDALRSLIAPAAPTEGTDALVTALGSDGDHALLVAAEGAGFVDFTSFGWGVLLIDAFGPSTVVDLGTIGSGGGVTVPIPLPLLPATIDSARFFLQTIHVSSALTVQLTGPNPMTILRAGF